MAVPSDAATAKAIRKAERKAERKAARKAERAAAKQAPGDDEAFNAKLKRKAEKAARRKEEATTSFNFSQSAAAEEVAAPPAKRAKKVDSAAAAFLAAHELTIHDGASSCVKFGSMCMLVLDEADRMLDMGFERDIRSIVWQCFGDGTHGYRPHQTYLYSATWPVEVQGIASDLLSPNAVKVTVGSGGEKLTASKSIVQRVHVVDALKRWEAFAALIAPFAKGGAHANSRVIVFANRKDTVKALARHCQQAGMLCDVLSGDRSQSQRESTIRKFKEGSVTVVIATDVAARGLDIKGIERVINYELPVDDFQDYVHRIGRTGRANATGEADSLFTDGDKLNAKELIRILTEAGQAVPPALAKLTPQRIVFD